MQSFLRRPIWALILSSAVLAAVVLTAALHLLSLDSRPRVDRDPLKADAFAADETGEVGQKRFSGPDMKRLEARAAEQFGPLPAAPPPEILQTASADAGTRALGDLERIREIRRKHGSAAAAVALKQLPPIAAH